MVALRLHVPVKVRSRSRNAFEHRRYHRRERLVNRRRSSRRTDEVNEASRGLRLLATTHLVMTSGEHFLELEPALRPVLTFTCSPPRMIRAFGRCAGKGQLHQLGGHRQRAQLNSSVSGTSGMHVVGVSSCRERGDKPMPRFCDAAVCTALVAARSSSSSGSHAGCTHGICMLGSSVAAYSACLARINRLRAMVSRSGGARESRVSHDLHVAHESAGKNRHVYGCTV